jgi:HAD superfamily hydrolase (TIGR01509 family)
MRTHPTLLLDVMGTLVHDPFFVEVPRALGMSLEDVVAQKHPTAWVEFEFDDLSEQEFLDRFFRDGRAYDQAALRGAFVGSFRFLDGVEPLLQELNARGVRPHLLSNYPRWWEQVEQRVGLARYAEWSFVSCRTRHRKPDPEAYLHAARTLGVSTGDCVFVDDVARNVAAAAALGMRALRFRDAKTLRADLVSSGVLA